MTDKPTKSSKDEYESHIWYNPQDNTVEISTNIQKHITAMRKLWGKPHESNGYGDSWTLPIDSFKLPRPKPQRSRKQVEAARNSIAKIRSGGKK